MAVQFRGVAAGFRVLGVATTPQNVMSVENPNASGVYIAIFEWKLWKDAASLQNALGPVTRITVPTGTPTGGNSMNKVKLGDVPGGTNASVAGVNFRHAASADGTASAITATAGANVYWESEPLKMVTLAGILVNALPDVLPQACLTKPLVIPPNENRLLQLVNAGIAGTATPAGDHYYPTIMWEEGTSATDWG